MRASFVRTLALSVASVASGLPLGAVQADALSPPPLDCPAGTLGRSGRAGGYCAPTRCGEAEHACPRDPFCPVHSWPCPSPEPWQCEDSPRGLCVRTATSRGSRPGARGPMTWTEERTEALGPCDSDAECTAGAHCELARRCVHAPAAPPPSPPPPVSAPPPSTAAAASSPPAPPAPSRASTTSSCTATTTTRAGGSGVALLATLALAVRFRRSGDRRRRAPRSSR